MTSKRKAESVDRETPNILKGNVERLKALFPETVTEGKVDFDKLKAALGDDADNRPERYSFSWAGKRDAIRIIQAPSRATLVPAPKESVNFDATQNLFIEGDNLEVLKLLYKPYFGRVKMIYIDPPYNDGNDKIYPDNYTDPLDSYLSLTKQKDAEGNFLSSNPETSGRFHSTWLSMMYPRLFMGRQLLRSNGIIFVSIDEVELANLLLIMDEIFGEENFEGIISWRRRHNQPNDKTKMIGKVSEYIVAYARDSATLRADGVGKVGLTGKFSNPDNDNRGDWASKPWKVGSGQSGSRYKIKSPSGKVFDEEWMGDENTYNTLLKDKRIIFPRNGDGLPRKKYFRSEREDEGQCATNWWSHEEFGHNQGASELLESLFEGKNVFDNPKPPELIQGLIQIANAKNDDLIMDFFSGSCSSAHAILNMNREDEQKLRFIMVQYPEPIDESKNTGRNALSFGLKTIAEIGRERIRRAVAKLIKEKEGKLNFDGYEKTEDLGFKVFKLAESNYRPWMGVKEKTADGYAKEMELFANPLIDKWKPGNLLWEVVMKEGLSLTSKIETVKEAKNLTVYRVTDTDRDQHLLITLDDKVRVADLKPLNLNKEKTFICRDSALNDETAANLALQCRLKTI